MDFQNNQISENNTPIQLQNICENDNPIPYQNSQNNHFSEKIQFTNQNNNNIINQQQLILDNNAKEPLINLVKDNKLEIPFSGRCCRISFFIYIFIVNIIAIIRASSFHKIYIAIILLLENILMLYIANFKIVIIKEKSQHKIYIKIINYLCITRQQYVFDLESVNFKVILFNKKYRLLILYNCKNGNEINLDTSNIKTVPLKFLYQIENIDVNKFKTQNQLNNILNDFTFSPRNIENPLNFDINAYMKKQVCNFNQNDFNKYIKINDNFYTYYNKNPLKKQL